MFAARNVLRDAMSWLYLCTRVYQPSSYQLGQVSYTNVSYLISCKDAAAINIQPLQDSVPGSNPARNFTRRHPTTCYVPQLSGSFSPLTEVTYLEN